MKDNNDICILSMCFNRVAQASLAVSCVTAALGLTGAYMGVDLSVQNKFFIAAIAGYAGRIAFKVAAATIGTFRHDVYVRDHGSFEWPDNASIAQIAAPNTVSTIIPPHAREQGNIVNLAAVRDARKNSSPNFQ